MRPSLSPKGVNRAFNTGSNLVNKSRPYYHKIRNHLSPGIRNKADSAYAIFDSICGLIRHGKEVKAHMSTVVNHSLMHTLVNKANGSSKKMPMLGGEVISSATGSTSETHYACKHKGRAVDKAIMQAATRYTYVTQHSYQFSSGINAQNTYDMQTPGQSGAGQAAIWYGNYSNSDGVITFGIIEKLTSNAVGNDATALTSTAGNLYGTTRVYFKTCEVETLISSLSVYPIEVTIYEVIARRDTSGYSTSIPNKIFGGTTLSPTVYWNLGYAQEGSSPTFGNQPTSSNLGTKPTDSDLFNLYWKILSSHQVTLTPGSMHTHRSTYILNKYIPVMLANNSTSIAGVTRNIMISLNGTPVNGLSTSVVGIGPATVNVVHKIHYSYASVAFSSKRDSYLLTESSPTSPTTTESDSPLTNQTVT